MSQISADLNPEQLEAVQSTEGPLLILAGAGSGKTRVLTCRIAHLVCDRGVNLSRILAMSFSNKAAREMHDRVKAFLNDDSEVRYPWISTFHSVCVRLLRRYGTGIGIQPSFVIYDSDEQLSLIKSIFKKMNLSDKAFNPRAIHSKISGWKNEAKFPEQVAGYGESSFDGTCQKIYVEYQKELRAAQALDFDDLLLECLRLLQANEQLTEQLQNQWQYLLIDEFQDTNKIQYRLMEKFINPHRNVCVVGDDDQSIYGWRGAKIENILNFDSTFENCKVVKLEQNYRSTGNVLKAAAAIIKQNEVRHDKTLWTKNGDGEPLKIAVLSDDREEARFVVNEIKRLKQNGHSAREMAVFYRMNSISRIFEEECLKQRLPYKIIGGFRFYERKEIKDVLAYLKMLSNPFDIMSFRRAVNTPARGIGKKSVEKIELAAFESQKSVVEFLVSEASIPLTGKAKTGVQPFIECLKQGRQELLEGESLVDLAFNLLQNTGYVQALRNEKTDEAKDREANLQEFMSAIQEFEETWTLENSSAREAFEAGQLQLVQIKLFDFLERVALISDVDQLEDKLEDQVTFMSFHAAKGLEFDICFMAAMEEGIFPSSRSFDSPDQLEEERRLCYVGITRARKLLYLTRAERRRTFGQINYAMASRFLSDLPSELTATILDQSEVGSRSFKYGGNSWSESAYAQDTEYEYEFNQDVDPFAFNRGDRVNHPSFGEGVVRKVEHLGSDECLTIDFSVKGRKKVLSQFVKKAS